MDAYPVSFDNTEVAFAHKTNKELKEAYRLFSVMQNPGLVSIGAGLANFALRTGLPVEGLIRRTIFKQFVGGETLQQTSAVVKKLAGSHVQVILDYGVEAKESEASFDHTCEEFIKVIHHAASQPGIPFMSIKITGFARFALLEKLNFLMEAEDGSLISQYNAALQQLSPGELKEWQKVYERMRRICVAAHEQCIGVLADAEESWIQGPIDALTLLMMDEYNQSALVIFNTVQLYRHDRLEFLQKMYRAATERQFLLGVKLVRGAYMEKERARAQERGYPSPIQKNKTATDADFNAALRFCIEHLDVISVIVATHNEESSLLAVQLLQEKNLPLNHAHIHFSQLYGMSDNITYNLAKAGCPVSKYLPFGAIKDVVPYLMRRARENTSVKGQTGRELALIKKEMRRRGMG
jgi:proline dehydrogenase